MQYSCLPNEQGGILDDLLVYRMDEKTYMLVVNASNIEKDWDWISKFNNFGVDMKNISDRTSLLAVQGPKAAQALQSLTDTDLAAMEYYTFVKGTFAGVENVVISATGYTGSGGFELYFDNEHADKIWKAIFEAGAPFGIQPIGLGARDTLRLEMGFCLYGNDIDDTTSPIEAGLGWITKFTKDFVDSDVLKAQKEQGVSRKLVAFEMIERGIPRHDYRILDKNNQVIGKVTSGTMSPSMKIAIGLGMNVIAADTEIEEATIELSFFNQQKIQFSIKTQPLEILLKEADFITLHIPAQESYTLTETEFSQMKKGVGIINTARGGVLNEVDLINAIESGKVQFAGLDVFESEPTPEIQLLMNPEVSLSPHVGGSTKEAQDRIGIELANQIIDLLQK